MSAKRSPSEHQRDAIQASFLATIPEIMRDFHATPNRAGRFSEDVQPNILDKITDLKQLQNVIEMMNTDRSRRIYWRSLKYLFQKYLDKNNLEQARRIINLIGDAKLKSAALGEFAAKLDLAQAQQIIDAIPDDNKREIHLGRLAKRALTKKERDLKIAERTIQKIRTRIIRETLRNELRYLLDKNSENDFRSSIRRINYPDQKLSAMKPAQAQVDRHGQKVGDPTKHRKLSVARAGPVPIPAAMSGGADPAGINDTTSQLCKECKRNRRESRSSLCETCHFVKNLVDISRRESDSIYSIPSPKLPSQPIRPPPMSSRQTEFAADDPWNLDYYDIPSPKLLSPPSSPPRPTRATRPPPRCERCHKDLEKNGKCLLCDTQVSVKTRIPSSQQMMTHLKMLRDNYPEEPEKLDYELGSILRILHVRNMIEELKTLLENGPENVVPVIIEIIRILELLRLPIINEYKALLEKIMDAFDKTPDKIPGNMVSKLLKKIDKILETVQLQYRPRLEQEETISDEYIQKLVEFFYEKASQDKKRVFVQQFMPERTLKRYWEQKKSAQSQQSKKIPEQTVLAAAAFPWRGQAAYPRLPRSSGGSRPNPMSALTTQEEFKLIKTQRKKHAKEDQKQRKRKQRQQKKKKDSKRPKR